MALLTLSVQDSGVPIALPAPPKGFGESPDRIGSTSTTLGGCRIRQTTRVAKTWSMSYRWLTDAQYATLLGFADGTRGTGPFELRKTGDTTVYLVNVELGNVVVPLVGSRHCDLTLTQV